MIELNEYIEIIKGILVFLFLTNISLIIYIWKNNGKAVNSLKQEHETGLKELKDLINKIESNRENKNQEYEKKISQIESDIERRVLALEKEVNGLQKNYLDRFEAVTDVINSNDRTTKDIINTNHVENIKAINRLETAINVHMAQSK